MDRSRTFSAGSLTEFVKRKRNCNQEGLQDDNIFQKSKKIVRSPQKKSLENKSNTQPGDTAMEKKIEEMAETLQLILEQVGDIKEIKKEIKEIRSENQILKAELENIKTDNEGRIKNMEKKNKDMRKLLQHMEEKMERREKIERKQNIVITGVKFDANNIKQEIESLIGEKLGVKIKVEEAYKLGKEAGSNQRAIAKLQSWKEKQDVMKNKSKLRGHSIYIDNDLTPKEREIQKKLREIGITESEKGNRARIGYKKIMINGKNFEWDDEHDTIKLKN